MAGQTRIDGNLIDTGTDPNDIVSVSVGDARYPRLSQDNTLAGNLTVDGDFVVNGTVTGIDTDKISEGNSSVEVVDVGAGHVAITTDGSERVRVDDSGNVGIGVAPTFTVGGSRRLLQITNGSSGALIALSNDSNESENPRIFSDVDNLGFATATTGGGVMQFYTGTSERMRLDSDGRLLLNHTDINEVGDSNVALSVSNNTIGGAISIGNTVQTGARNCITFRNANGQVGRIKTDGGSTVYETSSDYRLKENLQEITDGVQRLKQIPTYKFNFISNPDKTVDGFLAHEVQPYVPEAISGEKDEVEAIGDIIDSDGEIIKEGVTEPTELKEGQTWTKTGQQPVYQGIDQAKLVPLLTAALQEAVGKIEQQQTQIDDLLARVTALETK